VDFCLAYKATRGDPNYHRRVVAAAAVAAVMAKISGGRTGSSK